MASQAPRPTQTASTTPPTTSQSQGATRTAPQPVLFRDLASI